MAEAAFNFIIADDNVQMRCIAILILFIFGRTKFLTIPSVLVHCNCNLAKWSVGNSKFKFI